MNKQRWQICLIGAYVYYIGTIVYFRVKEKNRKVVITKQPPRCIRVKSLVNMRMQSGNIKSSSESNPTLFMIDNEPETPWLIKEMLTIINENVQNKDLSVAYIAKRMNMSSRSLYRRIKEVSDMSITEMVRNYRLQMAQDLLIKTKFTVEEIAFKSGFRNRVSFFKCFSKRFGCTPGEYRGRNN